MKFKKIILLSILFILCSYNIKSLAFQENPNITSNSAILMENSTKKILFEKDIHKKLEPASITKILTAILAIENTNLNDIVKVKEEAISSIPAGYSIANLKPNEEISIDSLLKLLLVHSANDAANVLAVHMDNSLEAFANRMNQKCKELNLNNTHFTNPSGMHNDNHYSTAYDIALLMQYCYQNATFKKYSSLQSCKIPPTNISSERYFTNTNAMILDKNSTTSFYYPQIVACKTGFTSQAKNCLVSIANKNGLNYTCVILGASTSDIRFNETKNLFEYGFSNYAYKTIAKKGSIITNITIQNGTTETKNLNLILDTNIDVFTNINNSSENILPQITLKSLPLAPIAKGKVLGNATYIIDDKNYSANLIAETNVEVSTSKTYFLQILLLITIIIILFAVFFWNAEKKNKN